MTSEGQPRLALVLTMGDPAGIGPELVLRAAADEMLAHAFELTVAGDPSALALWSERLSLPLPDRILDAGAPAGAVEPGRPSKEGAVSALRSIETAARACMSGDADAMVTAPVSKAAISAAAMPFSGHTEYLAELTGASDYLMLFVHGRTRIALATTHLPLSRVASALSPSLIVSKLGVLDQGLRAWFGISEPRIAVAALNPHAGEDGRLGTEEALVIGPALDRARSMGILVSGPFPADSMFLDRSHAAEEGRGAYDASLAMYHDQGTIPAKLIGAGRSVNVTLGLPIVRTSVDHGTAFDLAGKGRPDAGSMTEAIRLAGEIASHRCIPTSE
jgi:4-hydroxythreonine-4-phosphate dehydrogenase